ncbi:hypothetical protein [Halioxenophilus aromaticivorans]|uniref:Uncharacterized protein n=1 Tax=Halioxenophilus aromaticivorans TaxID=1306992 RepID=A0AAV3U8G7_9ALTE
MEHLTKAAGDLFKTIDCRKHRNSLIACVVCSVISIVFLLLKSNAADNYTAAMSEMQVQADINEEAKLNLEMYEVYNKLHLSYINQGVVGKPDRLQWLSLIQQLSDQLGMGYVDYTLNPSVKHTDPLSDTFYEPIAGHLTELNIIFSVTNEVVFMQFLEAIRLNAKGVFSLESCTLERNSIDQLTDENEVGFSSNCLLVWHNLDNVTVSQQSETEDV